MYNKEIERKWLVKKELLPELYKYPSIKIKQGYLSQLHDSLVVRVRSEDDTDFYLTLKDDGNKVRNEINYTISKEEFDESYLLSGNKVINKTRYIIPSTQDNNRLLEVDVFDDFNFIIVEYEDDTEILVDSLIEEEWFGEEITNDNNYNSLKLVYDRNI